MCHESRNPGYEVFGVAKPKPASAPKSKQQKKLPKKRGASQRSGRGGGDDDTPYKQPNQHTKKKARMSPSAESKSKSKSKSKIKNRSPTLGEPVRSFLVPLRHSNTNRHYPHPPSAPF